MIRTTVIVKLEMDEDGSRQIRCHRVVATLDDRIDYDVHAENRENTLRDLEMNCGAALGAIGIRDDEIIVIATNLIEDRIGFSSDDFLESLNKDEGLSEMINRQRILIAELRELTDRYRSRRDDLQKAALAE